jgi:uncharacterized peroxidase-related enzyme
MAHITLTNQLPGIVGLLAHRPDTARPLSELAQTLLRGPSSLTPGERELIAAHVSSLNQCRFCTQSHAAAASVFLQSQVAAPTGAALAWEGLTVSPKLRALLAIAAAVKESGLAVTPTLVEQARTAGATDDELHDTVLIAAAFCMYNRYVDGLATWSPDRREDYEAGGQRLAKEGYLRPPG